MFVFIAGCFTCCMESGVHVYNVDPLVEKAHFGKYIVIRRLDLIYECFCYKTFRSELWMFREFMHTWKNRGDLLLCKRILHM